MRYALVPILTVCCWGQGPPRALTINLSQAASVRYRLDLPDSPWIALPDLPSGSSEVALPEQDIVVQAWADQGLTRFSGERRVQSMARYLDLRMSSGPCVPRIAGLLIGLTALIAVSYRWRLTRQSQRISTLESLQPDGSFVTAGSVIGKYRVTSRLGRGGMATVFRAVPLDAEQEAQAVALKLIATEDAPSLSLERFRRECSTATRLRHPGLVGVLDYGMSGSFLYLALELVEGQTLRRLLAPQGLELSEALRWMKELAAAMSYCHERNVIHCDLKPENIMVDSTGHIRILDFGLARDIHQQTQLTPSGLVMGTPAYLAPERYLHDQGGPTPQVDQYALGVLFFELLTGRPPYESDDISLYGYMHVNDAIPSLSSRRPDLPAWIGDVVTRMLQKKPADRFESMEEVLAKLQAGADEGQDTQGVACL